MINQIPLPEGRLLHTEENRLALSSLNALKETSAEGLIVEGRAIGCDRNLNMTVSMGKFTGVVPRSETALGLDSGNTKDIAVLSRVGKPVSVIVTGISDDKLILSRKAAQQAALEWFLKNLKVGDIVPATVYHMEPFGAFVDIGRGLPALISIEKISTARIPHPAARFSTGQEIYAVVHDIDYNAGRFFLSHRELLGTWAENAANFTPGETALGIVRSIKPYGAFVELAPNLSGLTEPYGELNVGDSVSVYIKSINKEKRKIKLVVISHLPQNTVSPKPITYYATWGNVSGWQY